MAWRKVGSVLKAHIQWGCYSHSYLCKSLFYPLFFFLLLRLHKACCSSHCPNPLYKRWSCFEGGSVQKGKSLLIKLCLLLIYLKSCTVCKAVVTFFFFLFNISRFDCQYLRQMKLIISEGADAKDL